MLKLGVHLKENKMTTARQMIKKATKVYVGSPQSNTWTRVTKAALHNSLQGRVLDPANFAWTNDNKAVLLVNLGVTWGAV